MARTPAAQDDVRENRLVDLFNLVRPENRVRHGVDAVLMVGGFEIEFELKSVTRASGSISTVRDLGPAHIRKWRNKHWIVAFFDGLDLNGCKYGTPDAMAPWIAEKWEYIRPDFELAKLVPGTITVEMMRTVIGDKKVYTKDDARRLHKSQYTAKQYKMLMDKIDGYSPERMLDIFQDRAKYVIERGATLNNPHIPYGFFKNWPEINRNHATQLRKLVKAWIASKPALSIEQDDSP